MADHALQRALAYLLGVATLVAVVLGLFQIFTILEQGPEVGRFRLYVLFKDARGVHPGTRVLHRGMEVGRVASLALDTEAGRVRVHLDLVPEVAPLVKTTTQVWIVRPRFGGLAGEMSGLDTLIKESYMRLRVRPSGAALRTGHELLGMESPPVDLDKDALEDADVGDLIASVVLPERHELVAGSPVLYRGVVVGEVRDLGFTEDARGVFVTFRIKRSMRTTVREESRFWASRPILHGSLLAGVTLDDLGSLLAPALSYDSRAAWDSEPAADGAVYVGLPAPPDVAEGWDGETVAPRPLSSTPRELATITPTLPPWVTVRYRAIEEDTLSGDDEVSASGQGVIYRGAGGQTLVLVGRSVCDGVFFAPTGFLDSLSIANERLRVVLDDGRVFPARRIWIAPDDLDLAVLDIQVPPGSSALPLPPSSSYLDFSGLAIPDDGRDGAGSGGGAGGSGGDSGEGCGLIKELGRVRGWRGHALQDPDTVQRVGLDRIPPEFRPGS